MNRQRTNVYLENAQLDGLRERALTPHRSVADLVRERTGTAAGAATRWECASRWRSFHGLPSVPVRAREKVYVR